MPYKSKTLENISGDIKRGWRSKFNICCIVWFLIRNYILLADVIHIRPWFHNWEMRVLTRLDGQHVICPLHSLQRKPMKYYACTWCGWMQLGNNKKCGDCGCTEMEPELTPLQLAEKKLMEDLNASHIRYI